MTLHLEVTAFVDVSVRLDTRSSLVMKREIMVVLLIDEVRFAHRVTLRRYL